MIKNYINKYNNDSPLKLYAYIYISYAKYLIVIVG